MAATEGVLPREVAEALVLMMAPLTPHVAEELWARLGHPSTLTYERFPEADPALLVDDEVELPVQLSGKVRAHIRVAVDADDATIEKAALAALADHLASATVKRVIVVPNRLVNVVV